MMMACAVGIGVMVLGMLLGFGLVRLAALAAVLAIALAAGTFVCYSILSGNWHGWGWIAGGSLLTGLAAACFCAPILPLTPFYNRK